MRILVCGGRTWGYKPETDYKEKDLNKFRQGAHLVEFYNPTYLISGGAKGADEVPKFLFFYPWDVFPANWDKYGKAAGAIRNQQMLDEGQPNLVIAFPSGNGTADMIRRAKKAGIEVVEVKE